MEVKKMTSTYLKKACLLVIVALLATVGFGVRSSYAKAEFTMKIAHADSVDVFLSRKHAQMLAFQNIVNANSGGRIDVQLFGAGALGGERELVEATMSGAIQGTNVSGVLSGFFPESMILALPYLFPSPSVAWDVLAGPFGEKLSALLIEKIGLRNIAFAEVGFRNFTNNTRPIHTPADMKGLKFRVQEAPLYVEMVKGLGANPTPIAWPEVYTSLQTGVVDGQENPIAVILVANFSEVQKYLVLDGHVYGVDWFVVNEQWYQSLPDDLKYIVQDAARISATVGRGLQNLQGAIGLAKLAEQGMEIYNPTEAEKALFQEATQGPVIEWLKTKVDEQLINEALQAVEDAVKAQKEKL